MQPLKLHIVAFDVPAPPDYGGAIDIYYKIKALAAEGCEIYLHCYRYGRPQATELEKYCKQVWYYPRSTGWRGLSFSKPYIVSSRSNEALLQRLQVTDAPMLFEGVHTTYFLSHPTLKNRLKAIRTHNIEHDYYLQLAKKELNPIRKIYFGLEAMLLKRYELHLPDADIFFSLSQADNEYFEKLYPQAQHAFIPPFHQYSEVAIKVGSGDYCLYHGNLSHPENIQAATYLLKHVFNRLDVPSIIAGRHPSPALRRLVGRTPNCKLVEDPTFMEMDALVQNAHIHVLPTFQATGMKLKLLAALFSGRHVLVNDKMVHGTGLEAACTVASELHPFAEQVKELMAKPFTAADIAARSEVLTARYSNKANAQQIMNYLWQQKKSQ